MDPNKREQLVARLRGEPEPQLVPIEAFFDGNEDLGSIGCNLLEHPGIDVFRDVLTSLLGRPDVAVYAAISELDPGYDSWPFSDTVYVVGAIPIDQLAEKLAILQPDEVGLPPRSRTPSQLRGSRVLMAWWD